MKVVNAIEKDSSRIPCLDGLRAISILSVLLAHAKGTAGFPESVSSLTNLFGDLGNAGVRVFFLISGFLITHLLVKEFNCHGRISLRSFYIRRAFRIFPAFYTYLLALAVLALGGIVIVKSVDLFYAGTYSINFVHRKSWVVGHLWSLAVEEQFYLLWPFCVVVFGWTRATKIALGAVLVAPILRICAWYFLPEYRGIITKAFPTICDTIATGCVLACLRPQLSQSVRYLAFLNSRVFVLVPLLVWMSNAFASHTRPDYLIGQSVRNIGIALCIDWCLRNRVSRVAEILNWRPFIWIGTLSYSLYLWQQLFLNRNSTAWFCQFPLNVVLSFGFATLSYYLVERPCLRLRSRLFPDRRLPAQDKMRPVPTEEQAMGAM